MNEFRVELFIDSGDEEDIKISSFNEKEIEQWKEDMETRALSEYYKQKNKNCRPKNLISKSGFAKIAV